MDKVAVEEFWQTAACGEDQYLPALTVEGFRFEAAERYRLEPEIVSFAQFEDWRGKSVLEVGVGLGADHQRFAEGGALMTGIDLTARAVARVQQRFELFELRSDLQVADAESLPFPVTSSH